MIRASAAAAILAYILFVHPSGATAQSPTPTQVPLTDWTTERSGGKFVADSGVLRVTGDNGWIRSKPAFLNFVLRMQFRAVTEDGRGALLLRTSPLRPGAWPGAGVRIGLDMTGKDPVGKVSAYEGSLTDGAPASQPLIKPVGEWRQLEVRADHDLVTVTIDDVLVRKVSVSAVWAGYVGLESDGGTMEYRDVVIEPVPATVCPAQVARPTSSTGETDRTLRSPTPGVTNPKVTREVKPRYTADALAARAEGTVWLQAVVREDGSVGDVCLSRHVHPELDLQAMAAAKAWHFSPGTREGVPVPVRVTLELTFKMGN